MLSPFITRRWSPYAFNSKIRVEPEKLSSCLEAARWAPSSYNEQPWHIVTADLHSDPAAHAKMISFMVDFNQGWAKHAPVIGLIASRKQSSLYPDKPNSHHQYDCGAAMAMFSVQATELGLLVHQMSGFDAERATAETLLPEGFTALTMFTVGYEATDLTEFPELYRERHEKQKARIRKEQVQVSSTFQAK